MDRFILEIVVLLMDQYDKGQKALTVLFKKVVWKEENEAVISPAARCTSFHLRDPLQLKHVGII